MNLIKFIERMKEFSLNTFGPGPRPDGICEHIRSELEEIERNPNDVTEWCDVILLALDGAWRQGFSPKEIGNAIKAKQVKNENRNWPDYRNYGNGEAIPHIPEPEEGYYPVGTIIRYGCGETALMRVDSISPNYGGVGTGNHGYYGTHCMGGIRGILHAEAQLASTDDIETWQERR